MEWKPDWPDAREHFCQWWRRKGLVAWIVAPRDRPIEDIGPPAPPKDLTTRWTDPAWRCDDREHRLANTYFGGDALPFIGTMIGPGSLATFLGATPQLTPHTVWYRPCIRDPDACGPIRFNPRDNHWWDVHLALVREATRRARGRYRVGLPDLIENLDTLAALRGTEPLLMDLVERPGWVEQSLFEINQAYFDAFDLLYDEVRDADGGCTFSAFDIWGPGRTAKVQCDICVMISPKMFRQFVAPPLAQQCDWLDYSLYHLDGEGAVVHLDALLEIESLDAIEFTPQLLGVSRTDGGGSPKWYDLYRRIKSAGKSVQAVNVDPDDAAPLLDAVGPEGMYLTVRAPDQATAERVEADLEQFR